MTIYSYEPRTVRYIRVLTKLYSCKVKEVRFGLLVQAHTVSSYIDELPKL